MTAAITDLNPLDAYDTLQSIYLLLNLENKAVVATSPESVILEGLLDGDTTTFTLTGTDLDTRVFDRQGFMLETLAAGMVTGVSIDIAGVGAFTISELSWSARKLGNAIVRDSVPSEILNWDSYALDYFLSSTPFSFTGTADDDEYLEFLIPSPDDGTYRFYADCRFGMGGGDDLVQAGGGNDTIYGGDGSDTIGGGGGRDWIFGDDGDDTLSSYGERGRFFGGSGRDLIGGTIDDDRIKGGKGYDTVRGGRGSDTMTGGGGGDFFNFDSARDSGFGATADVIVDFKSGRDHILISQPLIFIGEVAFSSARQMRWNAARDALEIDLTGDGLVDYEIFVLGSAPLGAGDIFL